MAKDPATLWYWSDWHSGTGLMSRFLKGCYMDLLHAQFHHGPLSLEDVKTCLGSDFGQAWPTLQKKFKETEGKFFNERLENEKFKRKEHSKKQRENVSKRWNKSGNTTVYTKPIPLENEIENEIVIRINGDSVKGELSDFEVGKTIEYSKITLNRDYDKERTLSLWRAFLIQTEGKFYPSNLDRIQHFRYWIKTQPYQKPSLSVEELRQLAKKMDNDNTPGI